MHAILTETLACFLPGRSKDLSASLYIPVHSITDQISKTGSRAPPSEYNAWWSLETLSVYRLDDTKDICGLASLGFLSQSLQFVYFNIHNQFICVRYCYKLYQQYKPLYYRHTSHLTCSHQCPSRSPQTQPVPASRPLLSSSITAV